MRVRKRNFIFSYDVLLLVVLFFFMSGVSYGKDDLQIPEPLQPWVEWVLYDHQKELLCTPHFNNADKIQCSWPSSMHVELNHDGGFFQQFWYVQSDSWVFLPGSAKRWPDEVRIDSKPAVVVARGAHPAVFLSAGTHSVTGSFHWSVLPEYLQIPSQSGVVALVVNNKEIAFPNIDQAGKLWLKATVKDEKVENRLKIESFRLVDDKIPQQVSLYATLDVAGSAREILVGPLYSPDTFIPVSLLSSLPARLEQDGKMRLQVRPGRYSITLIMRHLGPVESLEFKKPDDEFWPSQEIWAFQARPSLRMVEIEGVTPIDPLQTNIPQQWQKLPSYRIIPGDVMHFREIKRGDPNPVPDQLTLERTLWLSFDGSGYTIQDNIKGRKNTNWRLEMKPDINLGRVAVDGVEQFITREKGSKSAGVELRKGMLNLTADSRYQGNIAAIPATGWQHEFQSVKGKLLLPPGWKLINAGGVDNVPRTWVKRWTLLDFFIVLIFTLAAAKIFSKPVAAIGLVTLVLLYHEPGAPVYVWLALLVGFALIKHLPNGKFMRFVKLYQIVVFLLLIVLAIPYCIQALRVGIYPQLAQPWMSMTDQRVRQQPAAVPIAMDEFEGEAVQNQIPRKTRSKMIGSMERKAGVLKQQAVSNLPGRRSYYKSQVMQYDPKSLTQTGPGLPQWRAFETIHFSWSGLVASDQEATFTLIGPRVNLVLSFFRVFLIILLALGMCGAGFNKKQGFYLSCKKIFLPVMALLMIFVTHNSVYAGKIPSPEMLEQLQQRLLEKDDCFPACADISEIMVSIKPDELKITAEVNAFIDTAVPLPGNISHWLPQEVLLDEKPVKGLFRFGEELWVFLESGRHSLTLKGSLRKQNTLQLPFVLKPHRVTVTASGWSVEGVHPDGEIDSQLQFKRIVEKESTQTEILETGILPSFSLVERKILLGLVWKVETTVRRISPTGSAVVLEIPLLPGESVTSQGIRVEDNLAKINLQAGQTVVRWESFLEPADTIVLQHPVNDAWTEIWKVDVSPVFHLESDGIAVIHHQVGNRWLPTWHPWPGEKVVLHITRPEGMNGQTFTIEKSHLELRPGQRGGIAKLSLDIKSSQGGQHAVSLPSGAVLQEIKVGGVPQPVRQEGGDVVIPIIPGTQHVELHWRELAGMSYLFKTSELNLGVPSVNTSVDVHLPGNRWPLFMGGKHLTGPAVLFWSVLIIVLLIAFALAKTGLTPLKFHHWVLLGIGMSMSNLAACLFVVAWLFALEFRPKSSTANHRLYNLTQVGIGMLTIMALASLVFAISQGLLGSPDMNIVGNGSSRGLLRWYHDMSESVLPEAWVVSIPILVYRLAMLAWALWISFWLISILKWGWKRFSEPFLWTTKPVMQIIEQEEDKE